MTPPKQQEEGINKASSSIAAADAGSAAAAVAAAIMSSGGGSSSTKLPIASSEAAEDDRMVTVAAVNDDGLWPVAEADEVSSPPRPASLKRVRTEEAMAGLDISSALAAAATSTSTSTGASVPLLPPPPDCPPYLDAGQLPVWVGRVPTAELTPERVDELHHVQWRAWKEGQDNNGGGAGGGKGKGERDYARILEVAPALFHAAFARMNPHNCAITVGITVDAMQATGAPPLACATTLLYGLSLLADNPSKQTIPLQFCRGAPQFMAEWAAHAFGGEEEGTAIESLLEFCGVFPFSGLPDALGKRVEAHVERLMGEGKEEAALALIRCCLEAPWAEQQKVWDEDIYWKLRLLSYICKRRTQARARRLPPPPTEPVTVRMACLVFRRSSGRLPRSLDELEAAAAEGGRAEPETVECGMELGEEQVQASLAAMRVAFDQFAESFLALTKGTVRWELVLKPEYDLGSEPEAVMPARPFHREVEAPTNPNRLVSQADVERCGPFNDFIRRRVAEGDEDLRDAQALLVVWPGLRTPGSYMLTCGGITPHGHNGRAIFMSDGAMLAGRPVWSPMWFHHEAFHILEHLFPEAPFSEASQVCGHPCFLRDQWPAYFEGFYEWDYYYHSYKTAVLHPSVHPPLAQRIARRPQQPHTHMLDASRREAAAVLARLALPGDTVLLKAGQGGSGAAGGVALGFKPGALPAGVTLKPAPVAAEGAAAAEWGLAAFWVHSPPCYVVTLARGGRSAHEALLDSLLSPNRPGDAADGSSTSSTSPSATAATSPSNGKPPRPPPRSPPSQAAAAPAAPVFTREALLPGAWPVTELGTDGFVGYAQALLEKCVAEGRCTFAATGASWMPQAYYACRTCKELSSTNGANVGCCGPCALRCHAGHDLEPRPPTRFYCDCGLGNFSGLACQCLAAPSTTTAAAAANHNTSHANGMAAEDGAGDAGRMPPLILMSAAPPALGGGHGHSHGHGHGLCDH